MKKNKRLIIMMASIIMIAAATVAGTLAWLYTNTDSVTNTFVPVEVGNEVIDGYKVRNSIDGDDDNLVDAYIRATFTFNWKNNAGYVMPAVEDVDFEKEINTEYWKYNEDDGYYYYKSKIVPGASTETLFREINVLTTAPKSVVGGEGFGLVVDIASQSIQADGVNAGGVKAVVAAWGVDPTELP